MRGSLVIVGTGIKLIHHVTIEAKDAIKTAEKVLYLVADAATEKWIRKLNRTAESLFSCYLDGQPRILAYDNMVERILTNVRNGLQLCVVFYGHPGVFCFPSHKAISIAKQEGFQAKMLPGISSEDCLFADLGFDPGYLGCQSYEATEFLVYGRKIDPTAALVLWQIGVIGEMNYRRSGYSTQGLRILADTLIRVYGPRHKVIIYESPQSLIFKPTITRVTLDNLRNMHIHPMATLYIPPREKILDKDMLIKLGLDYSEISARTVEQSHFS